MRKVIIATHGMLGEGLLDAAELITGKQENVVTLKVDHSTCIDEFNEEFKAEIVDSIENQGQHPIVMVGLFGGSPSNQALRAIKEHSIQVITGVNLPMLIDILLRRESAGYEELLQVAYESGNEGIKMVTQEMFE